MARVVEAYRAIRGAWFLVAAILAAEIGMHRPIVRRSLMLFLGLGPGGSARPAHAHHHEPMSPKSFAQQIKTQPGVVELIDKLLDHRIYSEIADLLNQQGYRQGEAARCGRHDARFTPKRGCLSRPRIQAAPTL